MKKILITGASGFIGSFILKNLNKNYFYYIIARDKSKLSKNRNSLIIKYKNYNQLNNKLKKIKVDLVIHCATHYVKFHNYNDLKKMVDSNILLGNIILENIKNIGAKKIINFSTTWIDGNGLKNNPKNLYAAYKSSFNNILKYYQINNPNIKFYNLMIGDTFGINDKRIKLINVLKKNYHLNKTTNIVSKNLYINLLNVEDLCSALLILIKKNLQSGDYDFQNTKNYLISDIIKKFNNQIKKKIKINWISSKKIKFNKATYIKLKDWKIKKSNIDDIIDLISNYK